MLNAIVLATTVLSAQDVSVDGKWNLNSNIAGNVSDLTCTFTQKEQELTGTCESEQGPLAVKGKVDGKKVTWQFDVRWEGELLTLAYAGSLDDPAKIAGTVDVQPVGVTGDFTATPAK